MSKKFTKLMAALALLTFLAVPMGMWGQTRESVTVSYGWEDADDASQWTISSAIVKTSGQGNTGTYAGKINTNTTTVQYNDKVNVTSFSYALKRTSTNSNYSVYIQTSTDGQTWNIVDTHAMSSFGNGTYTTVTKTFDGNTAYYVRFYCNNTTATRYVDDVTIVYNTTASTTFSVNYDCNGGETDCPENVSGIAPGTSITLASAPSRPHYNFVGWTYGATTYDPGDSYTVNSNVTFVAQWEPDGTYGEGSICFSSQSSCTAINSQSVTGEDNLGNTWTITTTGTSSFTANSGYYQVGSGNSPASSITFTTTLDEEVNVTNFSATFGGFNATRASVVLKVDNTQVGSGTLNGGSDVTVSSSSAQIGTTLTVIVTPTAGGVKCYNISYVYETIDNPAVATTTTINVPANFNTDIYQGATAGTLTATVKDNENNTISGATVTWSSSNTSVATIDANGAVTLVAVGTTTITASYAGVEDVYRPSYGTYDLTVINSNAPGTQNNPYSVAEAIYAIDNYGTVNNVYATGIVSEIVEDYSSQYSNITFDIVDAFGDNDFLRVYRCGGSEAANVAVGDVVLVSGNLIYYTSGGIYEFAQGCQLVSLTHKPAITTDAANNSLAIPDQILGSYDETGFATLKVSGTNLTAGITLALGASSAFEMSTDLDNWLSTITIPQSNGSITNEEVVIRLKETLSVVQQYTDNITLTSTGADNVIVAISGSLTNQTYTVEQYSTPVTAHGTITFAYDGPLYEGTTVTMTATPADGYEFTANSWEFYDADEDEEVTLTVTDGNKITMPAYNLAVDATFVEKDKYAITSVVTPANSGTIVTDNEAWEGKVVEVEVEAEDGYAFSSIVVCKTGDTNTTINVSGDVTNGFTFTMPAYAVTVTATFVVNLDVTYDFSTANNFYTTAGGSTHPGTGNTNNIGEFYYGNGDKFTASGSSHYFGATNSPYFLFGKTDALVNLPTFAGYKVTQIIIHSSTGHSTSVNVAIVSGENTVAEGQTWSTKDHDYSYVIPEQYQTSALSVKVTNNYNAQFTSITLVREYRTYTLTIDGYGTNDDVKTGWHLIASPVAISPEGVTNMTTATYDLYKFNEENCMWYNYKVNSETGAPANQESGFNLVPGEGYLYAHSGESVDLIFEGIPYSGNGQVTLKKQGSGTREGWNLVGNPFGNSSAIIAVGEGQSAREFYRMNATGSDVVLGSGNIDAMEGVFVVATENNEVITFEEASGTDGAMGASVVMNLGQDHGSVIDRAIVHFDESHAMPKFQLFENSTKLYIDQNGEDYASVSAEAQGEMPVSFRANENGQYTLTVNPEGVEMNYLHLIDNRTGADVDLLTNPSYTFNARVTDYESRFRLVFAANNNNNEDGPSTGSGTFAFFSNGSWIINNEGEATLQVIDLNGRILSSETINGSVSKTINATTGIYMMRLINGDNVKTQKVVVR